jgi:uncharacterized protein
MLGHLWKDKPDTALRCAGFQTLFVRGVEWAATGKVTHPLPHDFPTESTVSVRATRYEVPSTQPVATK